MVVYGYARLVGYTPDLELQADILERVDNQDDKVFTLHLRPGHKWSDGQPFTSEDFRYWWEDVANNEALSPVGPPIALTIDGELVGRATGGHFGFRVGKSLALGMVRPDLAESGSEVSIEILGKNYKAVVVADSPFDPKNERLRDVNGAND